MQYFLPLEHRTWTDASMVRFPSISLAEIKYCLQYKTVAPVGDRVLVKVDISEEKSLGGILLPSSAQKKPTQGHVEKAGTAKAVRVSIY